MTIDKVMTTLINVSLAITIVLVLLISVPSTGATPTLAGYYVIVAMFWLLLILRLLLAEWRRSQEVIYKSYLGPDNKVRRKLILPGWEELAKMAVGLLRPSCIVGLVGLALFFLLNHLLLFSPGFLMEHFPGVFQMSLASRFSQGDILLSASLVSVLLLAAAVLRQTQEIKQNNRAYNIQSLIINAHSHISLDALDLRFDDSDQMFISMNKLEYVLQAKPMTTLYQPQSQALLRMSLALKLGGDIPVTEYYIKRLSLFVGDTVIECENFRQDYYPLYAINNVFTLNFYVLCKEVAAAKLSDKFYEIKKLRFYYSLILKNSVGVISELYGTALYEKERQEGGKLQYLLQETRDNQYYYI